ncbi:MAG: hypothetical protein AAF664_00930 [Planctomycetota bacterium]
MPVHSQRRIHVAVQDVSAKPLIAVAVVTFFISLAVELKADSPRTQLAVVKGPPLETPCDVISLRGDDGQAVVPHAAAISPSGKVIAVGLSDQTIELWRTNLLKPLGVLGSHRDRIRSLAFSPDGRWLVSAGNDGQLKVWDIAATRVNEQYALSHAVSQVQFMPDSATILAIGFASHLDVLGPSRNNVELQCTSSDLRALAAHPNGREAIVAGRDGVIQVFDIEDQRLIAKQKVHSKRIRDVAIRVDDDGVRVWSVGEDGTVAITETSSLRTLSKRRVSPGQLFALTLLPDGRAAVAGSDDTIRIIDKDGEKVIGHLHGHVGSVTQILASGEHLYSFGFDATFRRWHLSGMEKVQQPDGDRLADAPEGSEVSR